MINEQVNTNCRCGGLVRMFCNHVSQNILHGALWTKTCSLVHSGGFLAVFNGFLHVFVIQFIAFLLLSNEEVNKYEQHGDSKCQFVLFLVNK